MILLKNSN